MHLSLNARKRNYQRLNFAAAAASLSRAMLKGNRPPNQGSNEEEPVEGGRDAMFVFGSSEDGRESLVFSQS